MEETVELNLVVVFRDTHAWGSRTGEGAGVRADAVFAMCIMQMTCPAHISSSGPLRDHHSDRRSHPASLPMMKGASLLAFQPSVTYGPMINHKSLLTS